MPRLQTDERGDRFRRYAECVTGEIRHSSRSYRLRTDVSDSLAVQPKGDMMRVLNIVTSPRKEESASRALVDAFFANIWRRQTSSSSTYWMSGRNAFRSSTRNSRAAFKSIICRAGRRMKIQSLVVGILRNLPLRLPSILSTRALKRILQMSDCVTSEIFAILSDAAELAIRSARTYRR